MRVLPSSPLLTSHLAPPFTPRSSFWSQTEDDDRSRGGTLEGRAEMRSPRPSKANSDSKSLVLSLPSDSPTDQPIPLCVLHPHLRWSRRLAKVPREETDLHARALSLTTPELLHGHRRSPRFSLPVPEDESSSWRQTRRKALTLVSEPCLRRSPRLRRVNVAGETTSLGMDSTTLCDSSSKSASKKVMKRLRISDPGVRCCRRQNLGKTLTLVSEQCLRRSPRLQEGKSAGETTSLGMDSTTLCDSLSNAASRKVTKLLMIPDPGIHLRRSSRLAVSPDMAVQRVDGGEISSEVRVLVSITCLFFVSGRS